MTSNLESVTREISESDSFAINRHEAPVQSPDIEFEAVALLETDSETTKRTFIVAGSSHEAAYHQAVLALQQGEILLNFQPVQQLKQEPTQQELTQQEGETNEQHQ